MSFPYLGSMALTVCVSRWTTSTSSMLSSEPEEGWQPPSMVHSYLTNVANTFRVSHRRGEKSLIWRHNPVNFWGGNICTFLSICSDGSSFPGQT